MDELAYLVGPTTFSRIPFSIGCHSPTDNNRFRGSLDCVLNAWQVEACYAKSAERGKKRGKEKERERETDTSPLFKAPGFSSRTYLLSISLSSLFLPW